MTGFDSDEIEQRLHAMRPAEPDPAVRRRVRESLARSTEDASQPSTYRLVRRSLALAAVLAVAGLAALLIQRSHKAPVAEGPPDQPVVEHQVPASDPNEHADPLFVERPDPPPSAPPTLLALDRAWRDSPQAFNDLLDRASGLNRPSQPTEPDPILTVADARRWIQNEELP